MKLYELNEQIQALIEAMVDPETGELTSATGLIEQIDGLQMQRKEILDYLAKEVLNLRSEQEAIRAEEKRLAETRKKKEAKENRLLEVLKRETAGQKTVDFGVATGRFTAVHKLMIDENKSKSLVEWLELRNYDDCIKYSEPEIRKDKVKALISKNIKVPYANIVDDVSFSLK